MIPYKETVEEKIFITFWDQNQKFSRFSGSPDIIRNYADYFKRINDTQKDKKMIKNKKY